MTLLVEFPLASSVKLPAPSLQQQMSTPSKADVEFTFASNGHSTHAPPPTPADGVPAREAADALGSDDRLMNMLTNVSRRIGSAPSPVSKAVAPPSQTPSHPSRSATGGGGVSSSKPPSGLKTGHNKNNASRVSATKATSAPTNVSVNIDNPSISTPLPKVHSWNRLTPATSENDVNVKSKTSFLDIQNEQSKA